MNHPMVRIIFMVADQQGVLQVLRERHWTQVPRSGDAIRLDAPPDVNDLFFRRGDVTWFEDHVEIWVHPL